VKRLSPAVASGPARLFFPAALAALLLCGCGGGGSGGGDEGPNPALSAGYLALEPMDPANWGFAFSSGVPEHPRLDSAGWVIDLPYPTNAAGSVHYVTMPTGPLTGKTRITMHYRVEASPGATIVPTNFPTFPSILTLYFQRRGDDWSARGAREAYRWYATFSSQMPIAPNGDNVIEARFDQNWTAVLTSSRENNPAAFNDALADAGNIGFVLGGGDGYGHGVYATGPARIVVTSFKAE
jgi:hypothetical protein